VEYIPPTTSDSTAEHADPIDLDWLEQSLSQGNVGLVAITAACNVTGELLPYEDVIQTAHQYGCMVLVDAAQIVGWQKLDLPRMGADMVAFGGHKGLQAPWGIGGLYFSDRVRMACTSATCEVPVAGKKDGTPASRPGYCDVGSVDQFALAGLHASIQMLRQQDLEDCLSRARRQIRQIRGALEQNDRIRIFGPVESDRRMPTLALSVAGFSSKEVATRLRRHSLVVGSGLQCAPLAHQALGTQSSGLVRISTGPWQADDEVKEAIDRLQSVLDEELRPRE
jgi:selenocysteine lyase/cysteine desulfurase